MPRPTKVSRRLQTLTDELSAAVARMRFADPVAFVYNPLDYAGAPHRKYVQRFGRTKKRVVFLGMNPGPFGMAQTGIPFGEIGAVRDWMGIDEVVDKPKREHEKRPILGFACTRSEVSGQRLWGLFAQKFGTADAFFSEHYVANYCPLVFMEESGRNRTPDKLKPEERKRLYAACDHHLTELMGALEPEIIVGVGKFARDRVAKVLPEAEVRTVLHPSPASPLANKGWAEAAEKQLAEAGVWP